jgi:nucleoside-diphosphate-sugar epimerase
LAEYRQEKSVTRLAWDQFGPLTGTVGGPGASSAMIVAVRVLVTGSRGFVGPWLISHFEECGDEVLELPEATDIRDADSLRTAMAAAEPDAVCHLAAQSSVRQSWDDPSGTFAINALGTVNVCNIASALDPSPRLLLVSSAEVYGRVGPEHLPVSEDHPFAPATPYAASKASAEMASRSSGPGRSITPARARARASSSPPWPHRLLRPREVSSTESRRGTWR